MKTIKTRIEQLEKAAGGPVLRVAWDQYEPNVWTAAGKNYPSLDAVRAAYPGRELEYIRVIWDDSIPLEPGELVITWEG